MMHSTGEIYVDTSLITCAEYQLFIDDQQARGNWHQPDHWEHASFATGLAQQPILGIRPSDAQAFCAWLTQRESGIWQYRLPKKGEVQPETIHLPAGWQTPIGFWEDGEDMFSWVTQRSLHDVQSHPKTGHTLYPLDTDLRRIRQIRTTKGGDRAIASPHNLASDLFIARDLARDLASDLASDLAIAIAIARDLARDLDLDLDLARARDLARTLTVISFITIELARTPNYRYRKDLIVLTQIFVLLSRSLEYLVRLDNIPLSSISPIPFWKRLFPFQKKHRSPSPTTIPGLTNLDLCNEIISRLEQLDRRRRGEEPAYEGLLIVKERKKVFTDVDEKC